MELDFWASDKMNVEVHFGGSLVGRGSTPNHLPKTNQIRLDSEHFLEKNKYLLYPYLII